MPGKRKAITFSVNEHGCHICTSHAFGASGYPCLWKDGRNQNMHRVLYEEQHGPLGDSQGRHTCDDRKCINLEHIVPGTHADNMADRNERNRHNQPVGERSGTCKIPTMALTSIRSDPRSQREIAKIYGVTQSAISRIKTGNTRSIS